MAEKEKDSFRAIWNDIKNGTATKEKTEQEKLAKTGNFIIKGMALWFLIPFFLVVGIVLVIAGFGFLDWLGII